MASWRGFRKTPHDPDIERPITGRRADILVAGCGTGREAVELGYVYPQSAVLAIDLSAASLAYGRMMADKFSVANITFGQADILSLPALNREFDYIACSGVLHHMREPHRGLQILCDMLRPGRLMRLSLYSRIARGSVIRAHATIAAKGYGYTADNLRRFRHDAPSLLSRHDLRRIAAFSDYYSLSECRDLLFHASEHNLDLPDIARWLELNDMTFLGFHTSGDTFQKFRRKHSLQNDITDLAKW